VPLGSAPVEACPHAHLLYLCLCSAGRADIFGQGRGYSQRAFVLYDGIHYDGARRRGAPPRRAPLGHSTAAPGPTLRARPALAARARRRLTPVPRSPGSAGPRPLRRRAAGARRHRLPRGRRDRNCAGAGRGGRGAPREGLHRHGVFHDPLPGLPEWAQGRERGGRARQVDRPHQLLRVPLEGVFNPGAGVICARGRLVASQPRSTSSQQSAA